MFGTESINSITILRDERQRRDLENIDELMDSIQRIGLINPIVVTRNLVLVAGERRLTACTRLGWTTIPVHYKEDLDEFDLAAIELEENLKRDALSWQDACRAVQKYHEKRKSLNPAWSQDDTARTLGLSQSIISKYLTVADALETNVERVVNAPMFSTALNVAKRVAERAAQDTMAVVANAFEDEPASPDAPTTPAPRTVPLIHEDFHEWAMAYTGKPFNLIHCDFPYGVNADRHAQGAAKEFGGYEDGEDVYWALLNTLRISMDNVVAQSAHLIFWFSMDYYQRTYEALRDMGWTVNPFPLIWFKSDNTGILPDPNRGPRRVYETAFFASRGDRKLTANGAVANTFAHPGRNKEIHMSEKPVAMLKHFMRMTVDEYTRALDPTAGSGNSLKAATALGAPTVLGIEKDFEFYTRSVEMYYKEDE